MKKDDRIDRTEKTLSWEPKVTKKNGPLYKAICEQLKSDIQSSALPPGTKLPPQRDLARFLGVNVSTVSRALRISEEEGLLLSTVGSGASQSGRIGRCGSPDPGAHRFTVGQADPLAAFRICPVSAKDEHDLVKGLKIIRKTISDFQ